MKRHCTKYHVLLALMFLSLGLMQSVTAQPWTQVGADIDGAAGFDELGFSVSLSSDGTRMAVGAQSHDGTGTDAGQVQVFELVGGSWTQIGGNIDAETARDNSGWSVSLSGDGTRVAIGAISNDDNAYNSGQVRVFEYSGGNWVQMGADIDGEGESDHSGWSVSLSSDGSRVAIGALYNGAPFEDFFYDTDQSPGHVRVYEYSGGSWTQLGADIDGEAAGDQSGRSVSLSSDGSRVAIGAAGNGDNGYNSGQVRVYEYSGGNWTQVGADIDGEAAADQSGWSVSLSSDGSRVAIGAPFNDGNGSNAGQVRIYECSSGSWTQVGADIDGEAASDQSGYSVSLSSDGSRVAIGANNNDGNGNNAGHARIYEYRGSSWTQVGADLDGEAASDRSGQSVSLSSDGSRVAIGAPYNSGGDTYAGQVRAFSVLEHGPQGGYALDFDGVDDYVNCGYIPFGSTMTYEAWIKTTDSKARNDIASWGNISTRDIVAEFRVSLGKLEFGINDGGWVAVNSSASVNDGQWHHVAVSKNGSAVTLYVDGKLDNTGTVGGAPSVNQTDIGVLFNGGIREADSYFNGDLDEVRIWSDVRTQAEIQANMHKSLVGSEANLVAYYAMSDGSGTTLSDNSSNGHTGTLTNGPVWKTSGAHAGPGRALSFDGMNDYLVGNLSAASSNTVTIEFWASFNALANQQNLLRIHQTANSVIRIVPFKQANDTLSLFIHDDNPNGVDWVVPSSFAFANPNVWHHLVFVYDAGQVAIYVDGKLVGEATGQGNYTLAASNSLSIGADFGGLAAGLHANVRMDEVRIWSDVRTEAEILANMYRSLDGDEEGLLAYHRLDQPAVAGQTTAYDISENANNLTLTNMDPATDWVASTPFNTWIGSEDSDWNNTANWSRGTVPGAEDVGIYAWSGNHLPSSANISARHAYFDAGVSLSLNGNLTLSGDLYNAGTFTTTGTVTFSGTEAQAIRGSGTTSIGTLLIDNAAGVSLEQDISTTTDLDLNSGALSIGANTLTVNGSITKGSGTLSGGTSSNLVIAGAGASTGLPAVTLNDLTLNRANGLNLIDNVSVNGTLTLTSGELSLNSHTLTLGETAIIGGTPGAGNHIVATSGMLRKQYSGTGSFTYPVGDGTYYTPITLNFTAGSFTSGQADISLSNSKHPNNSSSNHYLNRYWTVNSSGISGFSCDVTATYDDLDIAGTESELTGGKWDGASWIDLGAVSTGSNQITGTVSGFSDFTAGEPSVFPVEWLGLKATALGDRVNLQWETLSEQNSHYFGVERSLDQATWKEVGQVLAAGTSQEVRHYQLVDEPGENGTWYYRLRQVDLDGSFHYSPQVAASIEQIDLSLYPNPVQDKLRVDATGEWTLTLLDLNGRVIRQITGADREVVDVRDLSAGQYWAEFKGESGSRTIPLRKE